MSGNPAIQSLEIEAVPFMEVKIPYMSEEEFYAFCAENPDLRVEREKNGKIVVMSPVGLLSGFYENEISGELREWNKKSRLGKCFSPSSGFILPDTSIKSADAAWISNGKWKELPKADRKKFGRIVPDFIVEVRSVTDSLKKLKEKVTESWLDNGVRLAWLIDPTQQKTYIFRADGSEEVIDGFDKKISGEDVLPGFIFDLSLLVDEDDG
ncbi:MAG: Uma2 family endonuclease [Saprospiraceae bacterium]